MTMLQSGETTAAPATGVKDTTTQTFVKDVIEESKRQPVLVDFWADWCNPCKQLTPVLEKVVKAAKGKIKLVKLNTDKHPAIAGQLGIQSLPTVFAFVNGQPVDGFMGNVPENEVIDLLKRAELQQKVAANALDHQARFDLAVALNNKNRRQEAVDHLIEIVRRDRKWNDDGARKQLVQFFDAWGPTDEATVAGRKRLSSILFA